jgi:hypothetical protein
VGAFVLLSCFKQVEAAVEAAAAQDLSVLMVEPLAPGKRISFWHDIPLTAKLAEAKAGAAGGSVTAAGQRLIEGRFDCPAPADILDTYR